MGAGPSLLGERDIDLAFFETNGPFDDVIVAGARGCF